MLMDLRVLRCIGAATIKYPNIPIRPAGLFFFFRMVATPMELDFVDALSRGFAYQQ